MLDWESMKRGKRLYSLSFFFRQLMVENFRQAVLRDDELRQWIQMDKDRFLDR